MRLCIRRDVGDGGGPAQGLFTGRAEEREMREPGWDFARSPASWGVALASALMLSSCMSSEDSPGLDGLQSSTAIGRELAAVAPGSDATQERQAEPDPVQVANLRNPLDFETTANASVRSSDAIAETNGTSANGWRVLLRPFYNENARDLMDHWGRREIKGISAVVLEPDPETDVSGLLTMLAAARASGTEPVVSALHDPGLFTMGGSEYPLVQVTYCTI